jgi:hypothetical protein
LIFGGFQVLAKQGKKKKKKKKWANSSLVVKQFPSWGSVTNSKETAGGKAVLKTCMFLSIFGAKQKKIACGLLISIKGSIAHSI